MILTGVPRMVRDDGRGGSASGCLLKILAVLLWVTSCADHSVLVPNEITRSRKSFLFQSIPARPTWAMSGKSFVRWTRDMPIDQREVLIEREILRGNVPSFNRQMKPVTFQHPDIPGVTVILWIMTDYLAIGSDENFIRIPMNPMTAQIVADAFHCVLPTPRMVDRIFEAADVQLRPHPLRPGISMITSAYYLKHNELVEKQSGHAGHGILLAGHKKDVVVTNRLLFRPGKVAIYGWHDPVGIPIQPLSLVHHNRYADYSHGIRLVHQTAYVNGQETTVEALLRHPLYHRLLSYEGVVLQPRVVLDYIRP